MIIDLFFLIFRVSTIKQNNHKGNFCNILHKSFKPTISFCKIILEWSPISVIWSVSILTMSDECFKVTINLLKPKFPRNLIFYVFRKFTLSSCFRIYIIFFYWNHQFETLQKQALNTFFYKNTIIFHGPRYSSEIYNFEPENILNIFLC